MTKLLQHSVYELFYDATHINTLLFMTQLIIKDYFVIFSHISSHASLICIHKLTASSDCDDQILMNEHISVMIGFVSFNKFLKLFNSGLEWKQEGQLFKKMFNSDSSLPK